MNFDGGQLNKKAAHSVHRRVSVVPSAEGLLEVVEEEAVDADHLDDGPESLAELANLEFDMSSLETSSDVPSAPATQKNPAALPEAVAHTRRRSVVNVSHSQSTPAGGFHSSPSTGGRRAPAARTTGGFGSMDSATGHSRSRRTATSNVVTFGSADSIPGSFPGFVTPAPKSKPLPSAVATSPERVIIKEGCARSLL